jgi:hypothetical protein
MATHTTSFPHDEYQQAFEHDGHILIAVVDETYGTSEDHNWEHDREQFRLSLEREFGLRFEDGNVGPGADLPAFITLLQTDSHVPVWVLVSSLFFAGKPLLDNIEAWPKLAKKLLPFLKRPAYLNRQGAALIAMDAVFGALGRKPETLRLLSYRTVHAGEPKDLAAMERNNEISDPLPTLHLGFVRHIFEVEADGAQFRVSVDGREPEVLRLTD